MFKLVFEVLNIADGLNILMSYAPSKSDSAKRPPILIFIFATKFRFH